MYISNAISLNMLADFPCTIKVRELLMIEASRIGENAISIVGHPDVAAIISERLSFEVPVNRISVTLKKGEELMVGQ